MGSTENGTGDEHSGTEVAFCCRSNDKPAKQQRAVMNNRGRLSRAKG
ncbi:MAG: hypothetical protein KDA68_01015 [Planctomycetaceae bacterium]|nr:hypothetical protein [Planctomycetaceae bacterium]